MTAAQPRPRIVEVAFWLWVLAAVLLILGGLLAVTTSYGTLRHNFPSSVSDADVHSFVTFYRGAGVICILLGLAVGYLAGRTRAGDRRFRRATVALSFAIVLLVIACVLLMRLVLPFALLAALALIVSAALITRAPASAWFDAVEQRGGGDG